MRRGDRIGRVRRLRAIRPVLSAACYSGSRVESCQATVLPGELKTPINSQPGTSTSRVHCHPAREYRHRSYGGVAAR